MTQQPTEKQKTAISTLMTSIYLGPLLLSLVGIIGYFNNIYWLICNVDNWQTGMWILSAIGAFVAPLGSIMGFIPA